MLLDGVRVIYGIIDQSIYDDTITFSQSPETNFSDANNTLSPATRPQLAYLEKNYFLLDGSFVFPEQGNVYNVGWESSAISNENGNISAYIEYIFGAIHDSYGVQITFPPNCVAKDFTLAYYNNTTLVGSVSVNGNTSAKYINSDSRLQWNRVRITFTKVNPQQRARLWEVVFGVSEEYNENNLISLSASRATDFAGDYDDCGDFTFQFYNDGRFNIKDINDLPMGLQEGLAVTIYVKKKGSNTFVPFGKYYSEDTSVEENGTIITVSGYDEFYSLNDTTFNKGIVYTEGRSLRSWAEEVADDAGIELTIDSSFGNEISTGYITEVPHREALRLIAEAGNGILTIDKNGNLALVKATFSQNKTITADDAVEGTYRILNENKYLGISVPKYTFSPAKEPIELAHLEEILITTDPQELEIVYSQYPVVPSTVQIFTNEESQINVFDTQIYSDRIVFKISAPEEKTSFVTITGTPYNTATTTITQGSTAKNVKKIENNYLITGDLAQAVAEYQYNRLVNKYTRTVEVVTDTEYNLADEIAISTDKTRSSGDTILVDKVSFSMSYGEYTETVEGIDE